MGKCLNCGKEIPEGRKFCSSSCSAKYNNVRRQRRPWTEEQKQKVRHTYRCPYCGKESNNVRGCSDCLPFVRKLKWISKLTDIQGPLKTRYKTAIGCLKRLYFDENLSTTEIFRKTGISDASVSKHLREAGFEIRTPVEGLSIALQSGKRTVVLPKNNFRFKTQEHLTWSGKKVFLRSSYEADFAFKLDEEKVEYEVENLRIRYWDSFRGKFRVAVPDFYLPKTGEIVEIKSYFTLKGRVQELKDKFKAYREAGYVPKLILEHREVFLEKLEEHTLHSS